MEEDRGEQMRPLLTMRHDEEAIVDLGKTSTIVNTNFEKEELESHRAVYIGVHVPLGRQSRRRHRHRGHKHHHRKKGKEKESDKDDGRDSPSYDTPSQRVQFILGIEDDDEEHMPHDLFTELDELCFRDGEDCEWKETARWLKFEEDVEDGGERWSKPYVATLSLHSLFELRSCILNGTVMLDMRASTTEEIADMVLDNMIASEQLDETMRDKVREALLKKHHHQSEKKLSNRIPIVRSFADIGKKHSDPHLLERNGLLASPQSAPGILETKSIENKTMGNSASRENSTVDFSKVDMNFMKKIPPGAEASNVLVGEVDFLERPIIAFVRLSPAILLTGLTEVPIPTRFLFLMLGPSGKAQQYHEIGRSIATLMTDEVFHDVAYKAKDRTDLLAGIDEFLDQVTVLPPGEWDPSIRIEPPKNVPSQEKRKCPPPLPNGPTMTNGTTNHEEHHAGPELERTGRPFGGLIRDIKRKSPVYLSDFRDAFSLQCLASILFLYCACMSPVITFGGLLGEATENKISAIESLFGASMTGIVYSLFAGQPLTILGSTGPVLVFEKILFKFCKEYHLSYLSLRASIGLWTAFLCMTLVATDSSSLVCYITRFTEEAFAALICIIFIYEALEKLFVLGEKFPFNMQDNLETLTRYSCACAEPSNPSNNTLDIWYRKNISADNISWRNLTVSVSIVFRQGKPRHKGCGYHLDLLMVSIMLGVCSIMGLPWFVAATVLSISHVNSLKVESECSAPGEQPKFLGIREQRVTGLLIFILMGLSVFMTSVLKFIPMPVLYGVFLYMGVSSLKGIQFFDRIKLFGMPAKHQPDLIYLRYVPLWKVHIFTVIQLTCLVILWVIKATAAAVVFPMMVLALVFIRKLLDFCFTKRELSWLDDLMPESKKKKLEDMQKKKKETEEAQRMLEVAESGTVQLPLEGGNILKIPVKSIKYSPDDPSVVNISDEMAKTAVWKALAVNAENAKVVKLKASPENTTDIKMNIEEVPTRNVLDAETSV
ncbi:sodium bicarbonate cotransporter 3-like [Heterodontus francisci]|uniref:sodium bicarbonate cotransporter 3-like n=1 Tax=Heterodontus francisci TaxID=7792 RepID=UPI00355C59A1